MKFGLNFFPAFRDSGFATLDYFNQVVRLCEYADQLGYSSVKTVEHYFHDYGGYSPNPSILLAAIASRTKQLRLITGAVIPAFNNSLKLAGELAMLDNISQGRLEVGFGRGFIPKEFSAFQIPMDESRARFEEGIEVIKRLWSGNHVTFNGLFHHISDVRSLPRPVQRPYPPLWIAATSSEETFVWAGRNGYHLMIVPFSGGLERTRTLVNAYRRAWGEAGYQPGTEQIQMAFHCCIAESHDEAIQRFKSAMTTYLELFVEALSSWQGFDSDSYRGYDQLVRAITSQTWETHLENRTAFVGTPNEVVETVHYLRGIFGEIEPSMQVLFGTITAEEALRTVDLFASMVMPHFQD